MPRAPLPKIALPRMVICDADCTLTPAPLLKAMVLPWPAPTPPMLLALADVLSRMPAPPLPSAVLPVASVPIQLPCTVLPVAVAVRNQMPSAPLPEMTLPVMAELARL